MAKKQATDRWMAAFLDGRLPEMFDWNLPKITLDGCLAVIRELAETGDRPVNMKLAVWAGVTSINTKLAYNGNAVRALARYVDSNLPDSFDALKQALAGTSFGMVGLHYKAIQAAERLEQEGKLPAVPQDSWTVAQWMDWRRQTVKLYGVDYKVASFIGLLCCPETCPLVPVDRWVMRRLGLGYDAPKSQAQYFEAERMVIAERDAAGHSNLPAGAWHWYKWSEARQAANAEPASEYPESHASLSPRWY